MILKKPLGQNFLTDFSIISEFVKVAEISKENVVLEIGAGSGNITKEIAKKAKKVVAVEFDQDLIPVLTGNLCNLSNVEIINESALFLSKLPSDKRLAGVNKVVGAIPYQITSPLIHKMIYDNWPVSTFIVQKEVAEKICAKAPEASYLSNFVSMFFKAEMGKIIPPKAFSPAPLVFSAIIKLTPISPRPDIEIRKFSGFLHLGFSNPRKMLNKVFDKELLTSLGISPSKRPQELILAEWLKLYDRCRGETLSHPS